VLKAVAVKIEEIYIPADRRKEFDQEKIDQIAERIMDDADVLPIQVRQGKGRYVLVKGMNRLEARKALGDVTVQAFIVGARQF